MSMLRRCACTALALPSRSEETVKACNCTAPSFLVAAAAAALVRLISRAAIWPAVTVKDSFTEL